jgi:hypothetical protein
MEKLPTLWRQIIVEALGTGLGKSFLAAVRQIEERDGLGVRQAQNFGDFRGFRAHGLPFTLASFIVAQQICAAVPGSAGLDRVSRDLEYTFRKVALLSLLSMP